MNERQLGFAVFCIENVAIDMGVDATKVYKAFAKDSDILTAYIIPFYETLHTQGREYVVEELERLMKMKGVTL